MGHFTGLARTALIIGGGIAGPVLAIALRRAGIEATVYEARDEAMDQAGSWLALMPNGVNALKSLGIDGAIAADAIPVAEVVFFNSGGKRLGGVDRRADESRFGAAAFIMKRGHLHRALRDEALRQGITIKFGKRLTEIATAGHHVTAYFADGSVVKADLLLGCDGIHSRTRDFVVPHAPAPAYTGVTGFSGFGHPTPPLPFTGDLVMTFGKHAFYAYFATPGGEVFWFNNVALPEQEAMRELDSVPDAERRRQLLQWHGEDRAPIPEILRATAGEIGAWVVHDLPSLSTWHRGPVCLVGDAAHATSPHAAQGASLALEDAVVLAKCLRDFAQASDAFATYQQQRKERVERQVRQARRTGDQNLVTNPVAIWLRDHLMPIFLKQGVGATDWLLSYRVDWDDRAIAA